MSKAVKKGLKGLKSAMTASKIIHSEVLHTNIPAGLASPSPPLGTQLGQRNINIAAFVKEFNERTKHLKQGIPIPCRIRAKPDKTFDLVMHNPPATYYFKQAAGLRKGSMGPNETIGVITVKHLYEIAKKKAEDPPQALLSLEQICQMLVGVAKTCGIKIVHNISLEEFKEWQIKAEESLSLHERELQEAKEAKLLRQK